MYRRDLIPVLLERRLSLAELAERFAVPAGVLLGNLEHLAKSLKRERLRLVVDPGSCRKCGFVFRSSVIRRPGKCPRCRSSWIRDPRVGIVAVESA